MKVELRWKWYPIRIVCSYEPDGRYFASVHQLGLLDSECVPGATRAEAITAAVSSWRKERNEALRNGWYL